MATISPTPQQSDDQPPAGPGTARQTDDAQAAADLIREKVSRIYEQEPDAKQEMTEAEGASRRSKHQQFMYNLSTSGKDLAAVQTEWHKYYLGLTAEEKHQVWHEFYSTQAVLNNRQTAVPDTMALAEHKQTAGKPATAKRKTPPARKLRDVRSAEQVQAAIKDKVTAGGKLQAKHHLQSVLFGFGVGALVLVIFLFSFFNEVVVAPFIQPSRVAAATPLIVSSNTVTASSTPEVIIPKINVQIPVDYSQTTTDESKIETALENGVVHYPTTVKPGENGNTAFFGHSSNNIFNKGKYKFAFVLLHTLVNGDTFYLTNNGKLYVYKVISRTIVEPSNVSVLGPVPGQTATATLITCDPPGTSLHRLVVVGQQISPDPAGNATPAANTTVTKSSAALPGNGPTLGGRLLRTAGGKVGVSLIVLAILVYITRRLMKPGRAWEATSR